MSFVVPNETSRSSSVVRQAPVSLSSGVVDAWRIIGWIGLAYLIMSLLDMALGWYPLGFGSSEWEFGTLSATMAGLALPTLSLYLMLASALVRERAKTVRAIGIAMVVIGVLLAVLGIIYLTSVPIALKAVASNKTVLLGLQKSVAKSLMLFVGYETLYILGATKALRKRPTG